MRAIICIKNKDERTLIRTALKNFTSIMTPNTNIEMLESLAVPDPTVSLVIIDERFSSGGVNNSPSIREVLTDARIKYPASAVIVALLNDSENIDNCIDYLESGVDIVICRPLPVKDLLSKVAVLNQSASEPSLLVKFIRHFRSLMAQKEFKSAVEGIAQLNKAGHEHIILKLFLAKALISLGEDCIQPALAILNSLEKEYPNSLRIKELVIQAHIASNQSESALMSVFKSFTKTPTLDLFNMTLSLCLQDLKDTASAFGYENFYRVVVDTKFDSPELQNNFKIKFYSSLFSAVTKEEDFKAFIKIIQKESPGVKQTLNHHLPKLLTLCDPAGDSYQKILELGLALNPTNYEFLESYVTKGIKDGNLEQAYKFVMAAKSRADAEKTSASTLWKLVAQINILENYGKQASDAIQSGRKSNPNLPCWDELADQWREKFSAKKVA